MKNGNESLIRKWKLRSIQKQERNSRNITKIDKQWNNVCKTARRAHSQKLLKFEGEGQEFCKKFEITRTIYSN